MTKPTYSIQLAIYFHGDHLNPDHVSELLGLEPSSSWFKGEKRISSSNKEIVARSGLWVLGGEAFSDDLSASIEKLIPKISRKGVVLADIPGVQDAYVDILLAFDLKEDGGGEYTFQLSPQDIQSLGGLGLPVQFTTIFS